MKQRFWFATVVSAFRCSTPHGPGLDALTKRCPCLSSPTDNFSLRMSLNRPQPPEISAVASLLAMDRTTLTAALKPLGAAYSGESGDRSGRSAQPVAGSHAKGNEIVGRGRSRLGAYPPGDPGPSSRWRLEPPKEQFAHSIRWWQASIRFGRSRFAFDPGPPERPMRISIPRKGQRLTCFAEMHEYARRSRPGRTSPLLHRTHPPFASLRPGLPVRSMEPVGDGYFLDTRVEKNLQGGSQVDFRIMENPEHHSALSGRVVASLFDQPGRIQLFRVIKIRGEDHVEGGAVLDLLEEVS
jgi:hypothetical protein